MADHGWSTRQQRTTSCADTLPPGILTVHGCPERHSRLWCVQLRQPVQQLMRQTKRGAQFPMVEHHSSQSWHERFKKNSGALTNRVNRYMHAGIREKDLKTAKEVEHAEQAEASAAAAAGPSASLSTVIAERPVQRKQAQEDTTSSRADPPKEVTAEAATAPAAETGAEDVAAARGEHERTTVAEREGARLTQIAAQ